MAGQGQVPSRQAAVKAGIPMSVPSVNVNKVCLSGLNAIYLADQMIAAGDADIVVAGGMESMTNAPYLADGARGGFRYGNTELRRRDHRRRAVVRVRRLPDGPRHRALHGRRRSAASSRTTSPRSRTSGPPTRSRTGRLADEIVPVSIPQRRGDPIVVEHDEGVPPGHHGGEPRRAASRRSTTTARSPPATPSQLRDGAQRRGGDVASRRPSAAACTPLGEFVVLRHGRRTRHRRRCCTSRAAPIHKALERGRDRRRRRRPVRDQRGVRRRRHRLDGRPRHHATRSSTSTAARSPSATRSA